MAEFYKPSEQVVNELDAIKKAKEDQELWDKVAITCYAQNVQVARDKAGAVLCAFDDADVFMAERAKRMENNQ